MWLPPDVDIVSKNPPYVPANASALITMLPALAGVRYRIWAWSVAFTNVLQAPTKSWWSMDDTVFNIGLVSTVGFAGFYCEFPGGVRSTTGKLVQLSLTTDIASADAFVKAYYTREDA